MAALWRVRLDGRERLARGPVDTGPVELLAEGLSVDDLLAGSAGTLEYVLDGPGAGDLRAGATVLAPTAGQEIWCAGVTYLRSRDARMGESVSSADHYEQIYHADRPELFPKAAPGRVRGPGEVIGVRGDSDWDVPEPELAAVADQRGRVVAYTIGNDVSSRSLEGENPLYLPQAKVYTGSCALGPCLVPVGRAPDHTEMRIGLTIVRGGEAIYSDAVSVADMYRTPQDLIDWLYRAIDFPVGAVLLTGTAIVPEPEFTLRAGDEVTTEITGLGRLRNTVEVVGATPEPAVGRASG
ncbi:MAG: fumarylacetoacetate hydrolase family protein [Actinomycetota bacterium]|nr:fumarylacetoacetate hydrolase family protein [Actinomycetota bacterium]